MSPRVVEDRQLLSGQVLAAGGNPEIGDGFHGDSKEKVLANFIGRILCEESQCIF